MYSAMQCKGMSGSCCCRQGRRKSTAFFTAIGFVSLLICVLLSRGKFLQPVIACVFFYVFEWLVSIR